MEDHVQQTRIGWILLPVLNFDGDGDTRFSA
jgi:hypothetical protein